MARNTGSGNFDLGNYVEVKDRVKEFWQQYPEGRIITTPPTIVEIDGRSFIASHAAAYKTADGATPDATGSAWEQFPGKTPYTKDSEAMNAETSAVGRALGFLNIGIGGSLASAEEVRNRSEERNAPVSPVVAVPDGALTMKQAIARVENAIAIAFPNASKDYVKATGKGIWAEAEAQKKLTQINEDWYLLADEVKVLDSVCKDEVQRLLAAPVEGAA